MNQEKKEIFDTIESDFAKIRKEVIAKRNNTNKARSRNQEKKVAQYLGGTRVPMSGAGAIKGDGIWGSDKGVVLYECKYSAAHHARFGKSLRLSYPWLEKLEHDAIAMRSLGVKYHFLVVHFFNQVGGIPWGTCFLPDHFADELMNPEWLVNAFEYEHIEGRVGARLYYDEIRKMYKLNKAYPCGKLLTPNGNYVILPLWALRELFTVGEDERAGTDLT